MEQIRGFPFKTAGGVALGCGPFECNANQLICCQTVTWWLVKRYTRWQQSPSSNIIQWTSRHDEPGQKKCLTLPLTPLRGVLLQRLSCSWKKKHKVQRGEEVTQSTPSGAEFTRNARRRAVVYFWWQLRWLHVARRVDWTWKRIWPWILCNGKISNSAHGLGILLVIFG